MVLKVYQIESSSPFKDGDCLRVQSLKIQAVQESPFVRAKESPGKFGGPLKSRALKHIRPATSIHNAQVVTERVGDIHHHVLTQFFYMHEMERNKHFNCTGLSCGLVGWEDRLPELCILTAASFPALGQCKGLDSCNMARRFIENFSCFWIRAGM